MTSRNSDIILERMMALHPKVIDLTLDRVWRLLRALGNPQDRLPSVIHLAGTNGKGSTQAMIRAGLEGAGQTVHAYTSPHLAKFHERIRIAGELISEAALTELLDRCYSANGGETITYFEITTCAALQGFAEHAADYTLLETGMGGRLDVTNVVNKPAACVLTPIDLDHQQFLGDTLAKIAFEKAGILKRGVTAIVGPQPEEALEVIERQAAKIGADLRIYGQHWHVTTEAGRLVYQDETGLLDLPLPCLPGPHQIQNAGAAIATLRYLGQGEEACTAAMLQAYWPARMQRLRQGRLVDSLPGHEIWLDGGHNPAAGRAIAATLATLPKRDTHIICGMLNTKDVTGFLAPIAAHCASLTTVTIPNEINAIS
ncbi:MAG: bifunctional folylpolyglutamate synthase/dihydrofolate synthase, partial [Planktomarina temperata]|nr:bifunctional folylpolyglutamate synthase/dihydrofolate synthase [Planktomarina temperata]